MSSGTKFTITVNPKLPPRLERLEELANNLFYSWLEQSKRLSDKYFHYWSVIQLTCTLLSFKNRWEGIP